MDQLFGLFGARIRVVDLKLGDEVLELMEFRNIAGDPVPLDSQSNDQWFQHIAIVVRDMDAAVKRSEKHRVEPTSVAPQRLPDWNPDAAGIRAFYFRDTDNHNLGIIFFPPGKGDPRWLKARHQLILGIDHTAIVVTDTERSLRFYRDQLGFRVAGESRSSGTEQEYLNHVRDARLRITGCERHPFRVSSFCNTRSRGREVISDECDACRSHALADIGALLRLGQYGGGFIGGRRLASRIVAMEWPGTVGARSRWTHTFFNQP